MSIRQYIAKVERERNRLDEKIAVPPTNLGRYLHIKLQKFRKVQADLAASHTAWTTHEREGDRLLATFLRYGGGDPETASDAIYYLPSVIYRPNDHVPAEDIVRCVESWIKFNDSRFGEHLNNWLERATPLPERILAAIDLVLSDAGERGAREYGYDPEDPSSLDEEYHAAMGCLYAVRKGAQALREGASQTRDMQHRLAAQKDMRVGLTIKGDDRQRGWRPEHEEVETLYHATAFAAEIARDGFSVEPPEGRRGLGNIGTQNTISFTYDRQIAQNIVRVLKEIWMIAHGQLTARHIIGWMRHEGMDLSKFRFHAGMDPGQVETVEDTAKLYNYWLWMTKTRDNPVMVGPDSVAKMMKHRRDINDIGIIAAEVRLHPDDEFLFSEREFRVPADRVLSVKRVM